jgi:hypothetical protein
MTEKWALPNYDTIPVKHAQIAAICDDLARLYQEIGNVEQAREYREHARWHEQMAKEQTK